LSTPILNTENELNKGRFPVKNKQIVRFFIRLFVLFTCWFVVYALILRPPRVLDRPLTNFITLSVVKIINFLPTAAPVSWEEIPGGGRSEILKEGQKVFGIWDVCNGIDLMFIYAGILFLLPFPLKRKIIFSIVGIVVIIVANIIRVAALYYIFLYQRVAFDFSHHYLFTILMYVLIFYGWMLFIKKDKLSEKSS